MSMSAVKFSGLSLVNALLEVVLTVGRDLSKHLAVSAVCGCFASMLLLFSSHAHAAKVLWRPFHMEQGCVPLTDLYKAYPVLVGTTTPEQVVKALKANYENVQQQSFLAYSALNDDQSHKAQEEAESGDDVLYKFLTESNAVIISWRAGAVDDGVLLFTEDLCRKIYGKGFKE